MKTLLYEDASTKGEADLLNGEAKRFLGFTPERVVIGVDVSVREVEETLAINLARMDLPFLADASTDELVDLDTMLR